MTPYADIRNGLAANLALLNQPTEWIAIEPYMLASPSPPVIQIMPSRVQYDIAMSRGGDVVTMTIQAMVAINFDKGAQIRLDELLADGGPLSIKEVVESDSSLGGVVDDLRVTENSGYQFYSLPGRGPTLGSDWTVEILTSNV